MRPLADLATITEAEWLALRRRGIGSSDAPAVLGVSPWKTPFQLYAEKLGLAEDPAESEAMRWGRLLEPLVADEYARETGRKVRHPQVLLQHEAHDFMLATPDRFAETERGEIVVEIKTAGDYRSDDWIDEPPLHYQVQVQHLLAVTGMSVASLVVLLGGRRLLWLDVERNDRFIALLIERCAAFWERVEKADPPLVSGADREALVRLYPKEDGASVPLPEASIEWDRTLQNANGELKKWEAVRDEAKAKLQASIGPATYGVLPGGVGRYQWRTQKREAYSVAEQEYRVLRRLKA